MNKNIIITILTIIVYFLFSTLQSTKYKLNKVNTKLENILTKNQFYIKDLKNKGSNNNKGKANKN